MKILSTYTPATIARFLDHIRNANVPSKVTVAYIKGAGFKSSNDSALITMFKELGFLDQSGVPTELWRKYRVDHSAGKTILGQAIRKHYSGLFELYPDANRKDDEAIGNWIKANSDLSQDGVGRAVRTFKTLCAAADFDSTPASQSTFPEPTANSNTTPSTPQMIRSGTTGANININIELQIPPTNDKDVYDNFFAAMKKHLFDES